MPTYIALAVSILGGGGCLVLIGWLLKSKDSGRDEVKQKIQKEALDAAKHEAEILALPARSKSDIVASLRRKAKD